MPNSFAICGDMRIDSVRRANPFGLDDFYAAVPHDGYEQDQDSLRLLRLRPRHQPTLRRSRHRTRQGAGGKRLVYGGGSIGLMGAVATSVLDHGGTVTGII